MTDYRRIAVRVLAKAKAYDPRVSANELVAEAWAEHLAHRRMDNLDQLLEAVREYYGCPHERVVQVADITELVQIERDRLSGYCDPPRHVPLPAIQPGVNTASEEHRRKCMAEITAAIGKRWSVPSE